MYYTFLLIKQPKCSHSNLYREKETRYTETCFFFFCCFSFLFCIYECDRHVLCLHGDVFPVQCFFWTSWRCIRGWSGVTWAQKPQCHTKAVCCRYWLPEVCVTFTNMGTSHLQQNLSQNQTEIFEKKKIWKTPFSCIVCGQRETSSSITLLTRCCCLALLLYKKDGFAH